MCHNDDIGIPFRKQPVMVNQLIAFKSKKQKTPLVTQTVCTVCSVEFKSAEIYKNHIESIEHKQLYKYVKER